MSVYRTIGPLVNLYDHNIANTAKPINAKLHMVGAALMKWEQKYIIMVHVKRPNWPQCPYMINL